MRFSDIFKNVRGISYKVLVQTLRELERDGLITRCSFRHQVPPRVEYELSQLGRNFLQTSTPLWKWVVSKIGEFEKARLEFMRCADGIEKPGN